MFLIPKNVYSLKFDVYYREVYKDSKNRKIFRLEISLWRFYSFSREISRFPEKFSVFAVLIYPLGGILRRQKWEISRDPEKFSVFRTILETKKFLSESKNGEFSVFAVLIYPPGWHPTADWLLEEIPNFWVFGFIFILFPLFNQYPSIFINFYF